MYLDQSIVCQLLASNAIIMVCLRLAEWGFDKRRLDRVYTMSVDTNNMN